MKIEVRTLLVALATMVFINPAAMGDEVVLRSSARVQQGATTVKLADIAELSGEYAASLNEIVVLTLTGPPRVIELSVQDVRKKLDEAGVHWGKMNLQGGRVLIRPRLSANVEAPLAMQSVSVGHPTAEIRGIGRQVEYRPADEFISERTVRGAVGRLIAQGLQVRPDGLKLAFDESDKDLLDTTDSAHRIEIEAVSSLRSDRIQIVVRLWSGLKIAQNATLTVLPMVQSSAVIAARDLSQATKLAPSDLALEQQWVSPSRSGWFTSKQNVIDRVIDRSVRQGERLTPKHIRKDILIRRGDRAMVRCLIGGIVISLEVEARQEGAEGEMIEFRKLGERETFFATVTAPGEAVMDLGNAHH